MDDIRLMLRLDQRLEYLKGETFKEYGVEIALPRVDFAVRGTSSACVSVFEHRMSLNPILFVENPEEFLDKTIGHEWCHLGVPRLNRGRMPRFNHGRQWQGMMRQLHVPIEIDHRYDCSTIFGKTPKSVSTSRVPKDERYIYQEYIQRVKMS